MTKIYDLSDPTAPRFIRDFGLPGQEPGASGDVPEGVHGPIALRGRVYFAYGTSRNGVLQIVDRERLLRGDPAPTRENLLAPQIGRLDMSPSWGGHTAYPVLGVPVRDWAASREAVRDFVVLVSESVAAGCREVRHLTFLVDITTPSRPWPVSTFQVPAEPGGFCRRGGRFGPHASHESFAARFYGKLVFLSYFNAGVRAVDIRDPFAPREVAHFIPDAKGRGVIQTNNVEADERGYVYLVDRGEHGLHVVELTGAARAIVAERP